MVVGEAEPPHWLEFLGCSLDLAAFQLCLGFLVLPKGVSPQAQL